jgi:hypothetical protein
MNQTLRYFAEALPASLSNPLSCREAKLHDAASGFEHQPTYHTRKVTPCADCLGPAKELLLIG